LQNILFLLVDTPWWQTIGILFFICVGCLPVIRWATEGVAFNNAFSSAYGDPALNVAALIGVETLARHGIPAWMFTYQPIFIAFSVAVGLGFVFQSGGPGKNTFADNLHNFIIVPILTYTTGFVGLLAVFSYGTATEQAWFVLYVLIWFVLYFVDLMRGALNQTEYRKKHGVNL
jgi:hypothetical protein